MTQPTDREIVRQMGRECIAFRVRRASRVVTRVYDGMLDDAGLSATQLTVLTAVANRPDLKLAELAEVLGMEPSSLSRAALFLARKKWIAVAAGGSKRERFYEVTDAGRHKLRAAYVRWQAAQAKLKRTLGADNIEALVTSLSALRALSTDAP